MVWSRSPMVYAQILVLLLVGISKTNGLFLNTTGYGVPTRNISCFFIVDIYAILQYELNTTGTYQSTNFSSTFNSGFCVYFNATLTLRDGTVVNTDWASNLPEQFTYAQYIRERCSSGTFQPSITPIGYATCTRLPYETSTSQICICSTPYCNVNYASCVASVQASLASPPPILPPFIPELTNIISCQSGYQGATFADYYHGTGWIYNAYIPFNMTAARADMSARSVVCMLWVNSDNGDWYQFASVYENYAADLYTMYLLRSLPSTSMYAESSTSVTLKISAAYYTNLTNFWNINSYQLIRCICTTNNCNRDLASCAIGFNATFGNTSTTTGPITNQTTTSTAATTATTATTGPITNQTTASTAATTATTGPITNQTPASIAATTATTQSPTNPSSRSPRFFLQI